MKSNVRRGPKKFVKLKKIYGKLAGNSRHFVNFLFCKIGKRWSTILEKTKINLTKFFISKNWQMGDTILGMTKIYKRKKN